MNIDFRVEIAATPPHQDLSWPDVRMEKAVPPGGWHTITFPEDGVLVGSASWTVRTPKLPYTPLAIRLIAVVDGEVVGEWHG